MAKACACLKGDESLAMSVSDRRRQILAHLATAPLTLAELRQRLPGPPSLRTLATDFAWLQVRCGPRLSWETVGRAKRWSFSGEAAHVLPDGFVTLDRDQITALIAARGVLRLPDPATSPAEDPGDRYHGALAHALDRLLRDAGLGAAAKTIAPDAICVSRFGAAPEDPAVFPLVLDAIIVGDALRFAYVTGDGRPEQVHAQPIRLVLIAGEWHSFSWQGGKIKQYRLARMSAVLRTTQRPPECPHSGLRSAVSDTLRDAFRATGSDRPDARRRIVLVASPKAWGFLERRRWGADQRVDEPPPIGLPPDWHRLSFVTTGLKEARHQILSFGAEVRVEEPAELREWIREQCIKITLQP